jgi:hypothetical protein
MLKKILVALALVTVSSFAAWDMFPVLEQGKGEAKLGLTYNFHDDWDDLNLTSGVRYTVVPNLEIALLNLDWRFYGEWADEGSSQDGLANPVISVRYWLPNNIGIFTDFELPVGDDSYTYTGFSLRGGVQFSTKLVDALSLGSEAGLAFYTEDDNDYTRGITTNISGELDYAIPSIPLTPFVGMEMLLRLMDSEWENNDLDDGGDAGLAITLGARYDFNPMISADLSLKIHTGDYYEDDYGDDFNTVAANAYFHF